MPSDIAKRLTLNAERIALKAKRGFSLIELMIVVSIFGLSASLITASYLSYEKNQRVKAAATMLKNDLRLVQNKAVAGDKGATGGCLAVTENLGGWYLVITDESTSYALGGDCLAGNSERSFGAKTVNLPRDIKVSKISYSINSPGSMVIFFQPLKNSPSFHSSAAAGNPPDFFTNAGVLKNLASPPVDGPVLVELTNSVGDRKYQVKIELSGEISEIKP